LIRWAIQLSEYDYEVKYVAGVDNCYTDVLYRMPSTQDQGLAGHGYSTHKRGNIDNSEFILVRTKKRINQRYTNSAD
ncbi:hypothetical protein ACOME3_006681, partial [Neoechinorhynchus agilis]